MTFAITCVLSFLKACNRVVGAWCRGTSTGHSNNPSLFLYFLGVLCVSWGGICTLSALGQRLFFCPMFICWRSPGEYTAARPAGCHQAPLSSSCGDCVLPQTRVFLGWEVFV